MYAKIIQSSSANMAKNLGGKGMPSNISNELNKKADDALNKSAKEEAINKVSRRIKADSEKFEKYDSYKTTGKNGMPSNVANSLAYKQKYDVLNYAPELNRFKSLSSDYKKHK